MTTPSQFNIPSNETVETMETVKTVETVEKQSEANFIAIVKYNLYISKKKKKEKEKEK